MPDKPVTEKIPVLITGCQRSGTTLLSLILDSHPDVRVIDEIEFAMANFSNYVINDDRRPYVMFKLPDRSHTVQEFSTLRNAKVIWCIRDPRDVVLSMITLKLKFKGDDVLWASHPIGAGREISACMTLLYQAGERDLETYFRTIKDIFSKPPGEWSREDSIYSAALCWKLKHQVLEVYEKNNVSLFISRYEHLVSNPESNIKNILSYLGLPWHDSVLKHHKVHSGTSVGGTVNDRRIDTSSIGKWKGKLSENELAIIGSLCARIAEKYDYDFSN